MGKRVDRLEGGEISGWEEGQGEMEMVGRLGGMRGDRR